MGDLVAECIPYRDFWEKIRLVAEYAYVKRAKVEIYDDYIYVEYREGDNSEGHQDQIIS